MCWSLQRAARHQSVALAFIGSRENQHCCPPRNYAKETRTHLGSIEEHHCSTGLQIHVVLQHQPHFQDENNEESATD